MQNKNNKTLSAVLTPDSVLSVIIDPIFKIYAIQDYAIENFISKYHSGDFIDYDVIILNANNKFIFSDNSTIRSTEDFSVGVQKFTGQNTFVKFIQHIEDLKTTKHVSALIDHYYYLKFQDIIHLHFEQGVMHVYIKQNGLFILYNFYTVENEVDLLYFCNLAFESVNEEIKQDNRWVLSGLIDKGSLFEKTILKYFPSFEYVDIPITYTQELVKYPTHYYFLHYLNILCE
ncbi:MAG TPA: DUF3822 family protein [Saprospiraceae bacterium]|nr:DUF3822 family protein [Saprospiraceae bacterium]